MQACNALFLRNGYSSPEALHHLSRAYAHIKSRLDGPEALSDSTIGLVVSFIQQEQIKKGRADTMVHVAGLRRMVELRGGLGQLEGNMHLMLKICK